MNYGASTLAKSFEQAGCAGTHCSRGRNLPCRDSMLVCTEQEQRCHATLLSIKRLRPLARLNARTSRGLAFPRLGHTFDNTPAASSRQLVLPGFTVIDLAPSARIRGLLALDHVRLSKTQSEHQGKSLAWRRGTATFGRRGCCRKFQRICC